MPANQTTKPKTFGSWLWQIISASPQANDPISATMQTALMLWWYSLVFNIAEGLIELGGSIRATYSMLSFNPDFTDLFDGFDYWQSDLLQLAITVPLGLLCTALAYIPFRLIIPRNQSNVVFFVRCVWRTCLWATAWFVPGCVIYGGLLKQTPLYGWCSWILPLFLLSAPAYLAKKELRAARPRLPRWRPSCPECGYSLRKLTEPRCPECGVMLPDAPRTFRRWARQRLLWDRLHRGNVVIAYLRTVLTIIFRPANAARGLTTPDRYGRALRWAAFSTGAAALVATLLGSNPDIRSYLCQLLLHVEDFWALLYPGWAAWYCRSSLLWALHSWCAWAAVFASLPLVGCGLAFLLPGQHPVARRGIAKWSLYACVVVAPVCVGFQLLAFYAMRTLPMIGGPMSVVTLFSLNPDMTMPIAMTVAAYAVLWAWGASANPYLRGRRVGTWIPLAIGFAVAWMLMAFWLFPFGLLRCLL